MTAILTADQQKPAVRARDYLRVSLDRSGRARSLADQDANEGDLS